MLLSVLPEAQGATYVHVKGSNDAELRDLNAFIEDAEVLLRDTLFFFTEEHNGFAREFVLMKHLAVGCLLESQDLVPIRLLIQQVLIKVLLLDLVDG